MTDALDRLQPWRAWGVFDAAEVHLAATLGRLAGDERTEVLLAAALAARAPRLGDVCVDLRHVAEHPVSPTGIAGTRPDDVVDDAPSWPPADEWLTVVGTSPLVAGPEAPVVLEGGLLYLERYHRYEVHLAEQLLRRAAAVVPRIPADARVLDALVPGDESLLQRRAIEQSLAGALTVLVGGPGTGKTTTVAALVACLQQTLGEQRLALVAPTGKAAARLGEAFRAAMARLDGSPAAVSGHLDTSTVHRLLGVVGDSATRFRHDAEHPLPHDVVIVDESSMVSLPLMAKLLDAVRPDARVVLVGDPGQLASVEAGTVLADVAGPVITTAPGTDASAVRSAPLAGCVQVLSVSRRFPPGSTIDRLAGAIGRGDAPAAGAVLAEVSPDAPTAAPGTVVWHHDPEAAVESIRAVVEPAALAMVEAARCGDAEAALAASDRVRVLCAHRLGPRGVQRWNDLVETWLGAAGVDTTGWYAGRPVMVTANEYRLGVFNGDLGVVVLVEGTPMVAFPTAGAPRLVAPSQLEHVETVHATTIHKSQGSEFDEVVVLLPSSGSRLASRELLYTAVTRARRRVVVVGAVSELAEVVERRTVRASGLGRRLWGGGAT